MVDLLGCNLSCCKISVNQMAPKHCFIQFCYEFREKEYNGKSFVFLHWGMDLVMASACLCQLCQLFTNYGEEGREVSSMSLSPDRRLPLVRLGSELLLRQEMGRERTWL